MTTETETQEFTSVPDSFTAESRLISVTTRPIDAGIIFDDLESIETALRLYNGEYDIVAASSLATNANLITNAAQSSGLPAAGLMMLAKELMGQDKDFVGTMMAEARTNLAINGRYHRGFDYDGMGSNFLKTDIEIKLAGSKFLLEINAAYVGDRPQLELAAMIGRPLSISRIEITLLMSVVDERWYNVNLKDVLGTIIDPEFDADTYWSNLPRALADRNDAAIEFPIWNGQRVSIYNPDTSYCAFEIGKLAKAHGYNVAGASWEPSRDDEEIAPHKILLTAFPLQKPAISQEERTAILSLAEDIQNRLSGLIATVA